jgi:hypothetical protein
MVFDPFAQCLGVMVPELFSFFGREIFFPVGVQVLLHLLYDMFRFVEIVYLKIWWCLYHFLRMPALVAEFPFLEMIHVRKGTAGRAPDNEVHGNVVMCVILLKIYRWILSYSKNIFQRQKNPYANGLSLYSG